MLKWDDLREVRLARRSEVIWSGWLWPVFPAREMTACLSARDHVRFEGPFGYRFFPPADPQSFLQLVAKYRP